ncbi:hypothetical protein P3L10_014736 [Capsicum annuum]
MLKHRRKTLRALKGLVKLQALLRGFLVRKRAAANLHSMQALIRAQTVVRSQRARRSMTNDTRHQPEMQAFRFTISYDPIARQSKDQSRRGRSGVRM